MREATKSLEASNKILYIQPSQAAGQKNTVSARRNRFLPKVGEEQEAYSVMKIGSILATVVASSASTIAAKHGDAHLRGLEHRHLHHKGRAISASENEYTNDMQEGAIKKRTGQCQFPEDAGLVPVAGSSNGGWAMSPDQCCEPGGYCPYACPPGQLSMQWDPKATSYIYPQSMVSLFILSEGA